MKKRKFLRTDYMRYSKLGKNRKKLQKWRKAKGRDNKTRERRFGYPLSVRVGFKGEKKNSGKIKGKIPQLVYNVDELNRIDKNSIIIIGRVGAKKKLEIIKQANEMKFEIVNVMKEAKKQ